MTQGNSQDEDEDSKRRIYKKLQIAVSEWACVTGQKDGSNYFDQYSTMNTMSFLQG